MELNHNSALFAKKKNRIDFNAGQLLEGKSMDQLLEEFIEFIIEVSQWQKTQTRRKRV
jgi:altronate hydrolase